MSVLLLGPSGILETEDGATGTMADMLRDSLASLHPEVEWSCRPEVFFVSESMAERAVRIVQRDRPDAVALLIGSPAFADDFVVYRIRRLFPPLFEGSLALSRWIKGLAGGKTEGAAGPRGLIFRLPYRIARRLIGAEPAIALERAIDCAKETVDALVRLEDVALVCRGGIAHPFYSDSEAEHQRRVGVFNDALRAHCDSRRIPYFVLQSEMEAAGTKVGFLPSGSHLNRSTREFDVRSSASLLAAALFE